MFILLPNCFVSTAYAYFITQVFCFNCLCLFYYPSVLYQLLIFVLLPKCFVSTAYVYFITQVFCINCLCLFYYPSVLYQLLTVLRQRITGMTQWDAHNRKWIIYGTTDSPSKSRALFCNSNLLTWFYSFTLQGFPTPKLVSDFQTLTRVSMAAKEAVILTEAVLFHLSCLTHVGTVLWNGLRIYFTLFLEVSFAVHNHCHFSLSDISAAIHIN